ncbi:MAG: hypothetical protein AB4080_01900 [Trichodesmium sp.]
MSLRPTPMSQHRLRKIVLCWFLQRLKYNILDPKSKQAKLPICYLH